MNTAQMAALAGVPVWAISERALMAVVQGAGESKAARRARMNLSIHNGVAILPIDGVVTPRETLWGELFGGETTTETVHAMLKAALADPQVTSILLLIDSPGGDVAGVPELADAIFAARQVKPVGAHVRYLAASAAYWLASQAQSITAEPSSEAGSIGVFCLHSSYAGALANAGIETTLIRAGKHKAEWNPYEKLTKEAREYAQSQVGDVYNQFLAAVARGRGVSTARVKDAYGEGRTLLAPAARAVGMVDQVLTLDERLGRGTARNGKRALAWDAQRDVDLLWLQGPATTAGHHGR